MRNKRNIWLFTAMTLLALCILSCKKDVAPDAAQVKEKVKAKTNLYELPPDDDGGGGGGSGPYVGGGLITGGGRGGFIPYVTLWEGNNATQDIVFDVPAGPLELDFTDGTPYNDEARSASFEGVPATARLVLFDEPGGSLSDDYVIIEFKVAISNNDKYVVNSFEHSYEDSYVKVTYYPHNGLDGKVSRYSFTH